MAKKTVWINWYRGAYGRPFPNNATHKTKELADAHAVPFRYACIEIEVPKQGDGLCRPQAL